MENKLYKENNPSKEFIKVKHRGRIYTPDYLVEDILDQGHYILGKINKKHVIDNSCGDGQFMIQIVNRYCMDFLKNNNDLQQLKKELETYIHAIEIDKDELDVCINRCNCVVKEYGLTEVGWDFICGNALNNEKYIGMIDYVVGNPPYVRVHNLDEDFEPVKSYLFGNGGMTDLFLVFYEIGIRMLNDNGILAYITPSSFFTSLAGGAMRQYLNNNLMLESICDLKHFQPFNATTYTTIVVLNNKHRVDEVKYYEFDETQLKPVYIDSLSKQDYFINNNYYFSKKTNLDLLKKIMNNFNKADISVKNGYATLADKVFINDFEFDSKFIIPVLKASRGKWSKIIFPYLNNSQPVTEDELKSDSVLYQYLLSQKENLVKRNNEKDSEKYWYLFGRSQGINDTFKKKLSINALIRTSNDLKLIDVPDGCGVYSGLYIVSESIDIDTIKEVLLNEEFGIYISLLGKYKSGGYYTFSSKDVKIFLDYKLGNGGLSFE